MKKVSVLVVLVLAFGALAFAFSGSSGKAGSWTGWISDEK